MSASFKATATFLAAPTSLRKTAEVKSHKGESDLAYASMNGAHSSRLPSAPIAASKFAAFAMPTSSSLDSLIEVLSPTGDSDMAYASGRHFSRRQSPGNNSTKRQFAHAPKSRHPKKTRARGDQQPSAVPKAVTLEEFNALLKGTKVVAEVADDVEIIQFDEAGGKEFVEGRKSYLGLNKMLVGTGVRVVTARNVKVTKKEAGKYFCSVEVRAPTKPHLGYEQKV